MSLPCLAKHSDGVVLKLKVAPNASKTQIQGLWQDRLRIRIQAPPVEGKANAAICKWLAAIFSLRQNEIEILQGERGSMKTILLKGKSVEEIESKLNTLMESKTQD